MLSLAAMASAVRNPMPRTSRASRYDARHLGQAFRTGLDHLERGLPECGDDPLGHGRADAAHLAGGKILLDPLGPGRGCGLQHVGLELEAVNAVADPSTTGGDPLTGPDCGRVAD